MKKLISLFMAVLFLLGSVAAFAEESPAAPAEDAAVEAEAPAEEEVPAEEEISDEEAALAEAAAQTGEFTGTVLDVTDLTMSVINEFGTILTFAVDPGVEMPMVGSSVKVYYMGDLVTQPSVIAIDVLAEAVIRTDVGTVTEIGSSDFTIQMMNHANVAYGMVTSTTVTGKSTQLEVGQQVNVNYVDTPYGAIALNIGVYEEAEEVTAGDVATAVAVSQLINKKLTGTVKKVTGSKITIRTKKGKNWTFTLSGATSVTGKYTLKAGATVTVTYDGYASDHPVAKVIHVRKAASTRTLHTKRGTCEYYHDSMIKLTNGFLADCIKAKHSGKGKHKAGTKVKVTYYNKNGQHMATRVKWYK